MAATIALSDGAAAIFTKLTGFLAGLLLVLYAGLGLLLSHTSLVSGPSRAQICRLWLCQQPATDSPTEMNAPHNESLAHARQELLLNPASAYRWADLADSELNISNVAAGKFSVRQALAAAPGNPAILFRAAEFYLRLQDYPETLRQLTAVLRNPELAGYYDGVFAIYSQMDLPFEELLNQGLPRSPEASNAFLHYWVSQGKMDEAQETWDWINRNSLASLKSAGSYISFLTRQARWDEAVQSWGDYTARLDSTYLKTNWIFNPSFELKPVDSPFDWHLQPQPGLSVTRDPDVSYSGHASLRLTYSATPKDETSAAYQTVLLQPGEWQLKAAIKTRQLTSDNGVVVRIVDLQNPALLDVTTVSIEGTEDWTSVSKAFTVTPATRLARVEISRPQGRDFDARLTGTVWVDAVELEPNESLKPAGLTQASNPCKSQSNCMDGQAGFHAAANQSSQE
jgi:tetratricopeptide (TPR) repeat protein